MRQALSNTAAGKARWETSPNSNRISNEYDCNSVYIAQTSAHPFLPLFLPEKSQKTTGDTVFKKPDIKMSIIILLITMINNKQNKTS